MSYLVLARKYRPRSFTEMVGQEHVVQALGNALTQQRLHHAYLFTGTRGVGKTTVSRILAKSLNCTGEDGRGGITASPCGRCEACRDIDAGRFVDYVELDAASNRGVEEISQLLDQSVYKPVVGRFKVYMIDEVHMLSTTAFNAMLKTLEEPPDYLKFVLATTDPQKVPVTVLSRCLQFNLRPMAPVTIFEHLQHVLEAETLESEPGALRLIARGARGSMRDALSLTDQAIAFGAGVLTEAGVRQMLGAVDRSHVIRIVEAMVASDGAALVAVSDTLRRDGLSAAGTLEELAQVAQQMAVMQAVPDAGDPLDPDTPALQALAAALPADETQLLYSIALHGRGELGLAPDEYAGLTMVLLRLLTFRPQGGSGSSAPGAGRSGGGSVAGGSAPLGGGAMCAGAPGGVRAGASPGLAPVAAVAASDGLRPARAASPVAAAVARSAPPALPTAASPARPTAAARPPATPMPAAPATQRPQRPAAPVADDVPPWDDIPPADLDAPPAPPMGTIDVGGGEPRRTDDVALVAPPADAPALPTYEPDPGNDAWVALARRLIAANAVQALTRELAVQAQCIASRIDPEHAGRTRWTLRVERESLRQPGHVDKLVKAVREVTGDEVLIDLEAGAVTDNLARRDAHHKALVQAQAEESFRTDPRVVQLLGRFATARIVPGSIRPV